MGVCVCGHRAVRGGCWPGSKLGLPVRVAWVGGMGGTALLATLMPTSLKSHIPEPQSHPTLCSFLCPPPCLQSQPHNLCFIFTVWGEGGVFRDPVLWPGLKSIVRRIGVAVQGQRKGGWGAGEAVSLNFQGAENPWWAGSQNFILPWGKGNPTEGWLGIRLGWGIWTDT